MDRRAYGSGKSTLVNLIPRFYDATKGSVTVDGQDVKAYTFRHLREKIGVVPQKAVLFLDASEVTFSGIGKRCERERTVESPARSRRRKKW